MEENYLNYSNESQRMKYRSMNKSNEKLKRKVFFNEEIENSHLNEINHYKIRSEELNKDLVEKMSIISNLQDRIKSLENHVKNYKKTLQNLTDKDSNVDTYVIEINTKNKKIHDLEEEINNLQVEIINYQENIANKNSVIDEFQNLVKLSTNKFKIFEDTNSEILRENSNLKARIDDISNKLNEEISKNTSLQSENENLKKNIIGKDNEFQRLKEEMKRSEEKLYRKIEEMDKSYKEKISSNTQNIREDYVTNISKMNTEAESLILETEKLKLEKSNLILKLEEYDQIFKEKEIEFKKILSFKDDEYDNLAKTIRELQSELRELDANYRTKSEDFKLQINQLQNDDEKKIYVINSKEKQIMDLKNEINRLNSHIEELNQQISLLKGDVSNKENTIVKLNNDLNNFLNDLKLYEYKLRSNDENYDRSREDLIDKIRLNEAEKENLGNEKKSLKEEILRLKKTITEMENYYSNKKKDIEYETSILIEKNSNDIAKSFKLKEEEYVIEIRNLEKLIEEREKQKDDVCYKLENKIYKQQVKIGELEARNNNLIRSLSSLKDMTLQIEKNFLNKLDYFNSVRTSLRNNTNIENDDLKYLKIKENLKEMVNKLDYNLRNFGEMSNFNDSYATNAYYRSQNNVNTINESYNGYGRNEAD